MPEPHNLTSLTTREAVADALHRCMLGIDSNDRELFETSVIKDESLIFSFGTMKVEGWNAVNSFFQILWQLATTHIITNIRVDVKDGANTASMTTHAVAYHYRPEEALLEEDKSYTAGSIYHLGLVKDSGDGLWKIQKWDIQVIWTRGDSAVVRP